MEKAMIDIKPGDKIVVQNDSFAFPRYEVGIVSSVSPVMMKWVRAWGQKEAWWRDDPPKSRARRDVFRVLPEDANLQEISESIRESSKQAGQETLEVLQRHKQRILSL